MMKIPLTKGQYAMVDDEDYKYLSQWKWCAKEHRGIYYAWRSIWIVGKGHGRHEYMHRVIMNTPDGMITDHIDHNGLNNQRSNLRICSNTENLRNRKSKGRSGFLGVFYNKHHNAIYAKICVNRNQIFLGNFKNETLAAMAYDHAAKKYFGEFANLNFK